MQVQQDDHDNMGPNGVMGCVYFENVDITTSAFKMYAQEDTRSLT